MFKTWSHNSFIYSITNTQSNTPNALCNHKLSLTEFFRFASFFSPLAFMRSLSDKKFLTTRKFHSTLLVEFSPTTNMPKVSIITINFNNAEGLKATAGSVISQTRFDEIEWIIIDGGSTDASVDIIHEYADKISYWVSEKDRGIYHAMNKGIAQAHGEYLLFRNSGDLMSSPDTVEKFIQHPAYGKYDHCWGITELMHNYQWLRDSYPVEEFKLTDFFGGLDYHPSAFIRRERFSYETYDENLKIASDTKFLFKDIVLRNASYTPLDFPVAKFDNNGISATNQELSMQEVYSYLEEYLPAILVRECKQARNYPSETKRILALLTRLDAWEHHLLANIAYFIYIPRYITKKLHIFFKKNFTKLP